MIKILIVDDHPIVRRGLRTVFSTASDFKVVAEAANGAEAIDNVRNKEIDVVLLDISLPNQNGIEILKQIKSEKPEVAVLMLSVYPEEQYAVRALRDGASGYLTKDTKSSIIMDAIRKVYEGGKYISPTLAENLAFYLESDITKPLHEKLSDREFEVMLLIAEGKKAREIADKLYISEKTVGTYKSRIMKKLNVRNDVELTIYAIRNNLIH
jgi:DNA-binding NarL/FixJ family response regulator